MGVDGGKQCKGVDKGEFVHYIRSNGRAYQRGVPCRLCIHIYAYNQSSRLQMALTPPMSEYLRVRKRLTSARRAMYVRAGC